MRISDWSSDVCSSDLATEANAPKPCRNGQAAVNSSKNPSIVLLAEPETSASVLYGLYDVLLSVGAVYTDMVAGIPRSEEHTSELQSLMRISYAVFCLKKKNKKTNYTQNKA